MTSEPSGIHCAQDRRAWTDLVTNLTVLTGVDLEKHLGNFVVSGRFPHSCLPGFLHELTHPWCFQPPVAAALALLRLRARRSALLTASGDKIRDDLRVAEDVIRYETAVALLRPLSEGLALFAEFDVIPSPASRSMPVPFNWVYRSFTSPDEAELRDKFGFSLYSLLWNMRTHDIYVDRKSNVLLDAMDAGSEGYLPGYLTVKNFWRLLNSRSGLFNDSELYFSFMKQFIYDDYGLVRIILASDAADIDAANDIAGHI